MRRGMLMHDIMKFRMRPRDRYECDVPHPLSLDGKYHMFCSRENKQSRIYKIGVHYDLQNSSMFPLTGGSRISGKGVQTHREGVRFQHFA